MRIAYIISAYKYPELLIRLVRRLYTRNTSFFIHVDKKAEDAVYRRIVDGLAGMPGVHFLNRHVCYWGGFGHVRATLKAIERIVATQTPFDFAVLLTGQDYPIKSNDRIDAFFEANPDTAFIDYFPLPSAYWQRGGLERVRSWHFRLFGRHVRVPGKRMIPNGFQPYGGSSYWCLPRPCVAYIHAFVGQNQNFVRFFKYVDVPDELFFQTILLNSSWRQHVVNDNLRYIDWKEPDAGSPGILDKADFAKMAGSPKLFARKFDMTVDAEVLDMIDRELLGVSLRKEEAQSFQDVGIDRRVRRESEGEFYTTQ